MRGGGGGQVGGRRKRAGEGEAHDDGMDGAALLSPRLEQEQASGAFVAEGNPIRACVPP